LGEIKQHRQDDLTSDLSRNEYFFLDFRRERERERERDRRHRRYLRAALFCEKLLSVHPLENKKKKEKRNMCA
jgi:hypothetical protein